MSKKIVTAATVRTWAKSTDLSTVEGLPAGHVIARQGRLHPSLVKAFNAAHKGKAEHVQGTKIPKTVKVTTVRVSEKGRKTPVTKNVVVSEARAAALAAGVQVGKRGRVTPQVLAAFATGDFSAFTE